MCEWVPTKAIEDLLHDDDEEQSLFGCLIGMDFVTERKPPSPFRQKAHKKIIKIQEGLKLTLDLYIYKYRLALLLRGRVEGGTPHCIC